MNIKRYDSSLKAVWDNFVRKSKNGTFLFLRDYMEYHQDRFLDHSLMITDQKGKLVSLLPANQQEDAIVSHGGLTYGGFVTDDKMKVPKMLGVFDATLSYMGKRSFRKFIYKTVPHIYHRCPSEEDRYAMFLCRALLVSRSVITVVDTRRLLPFQNRRTRGLKKATEKGLTVRQSGDFETYWQILTDLLHKTYDAEPVHSLHEMKLLHSMFPNNIKLFGCFKGLNISQS